MSSRPLHDLFATAPIDRPSRRGVIGGGFGLAFAALLPACSEVVPEPRRIKWGRDVCEHCHMVFGDKRFAAQIWDASSNRARIYDDFGCAVLAAVDLEILDRPEVPFWVTDDADPSRWLDARKARFRDGVVTPMGYGHSAGPATDHPLAFAEAAKAIRDKAECEHKS